jgi:hypothetical protein
LKLLFLKSLRIIGDCVPIRIIPGGDFDMIGRLLPGTRIHQSAAIAPYNLAQLRDAWAEDHGGVVNPAEITQY